MSKKHLILALCFGITSAAISAEAGRAAAPASSDATNFQASPFAECKDVSLIGQSDFDKDKEFWSQAVDCGANVQVLPDTGLASFGRALIGKIGSSGDQRLAMSNFLEQVGVRAYAHLQDNIEMTGNLVACAKHNDKELGDHFDPKNCGSLLGDVKDVLKDVGPKARMELAILRAASGPLSKLGNAFKGMTGLNMPIENLKLSADEQKQVDSAVAKITATADKEIEKRTNQYMSDNGCDAKSVALVDEATLGAQCNKDFSGEVWGEVFNEHAGKYSQLLQSAPVLAYLNDNSKEPSDAHIAEAAQAVLNNQAKEAQKIQDTIKYESKYVSTDGSKGEGAMHQLFNDTEGARGKSMVDFLKYSNVAREVLADDKTQCQGATIATNFAINDGRVNGTILGGAMIVGGIATGGMLPSAMAAGGAGAFLASAGALSLTAIPSGINYYKDYKNYADTKQRSFASLHDVDGKQGKTAALSDIKDFDEARDTMAMDFAQMGTGMDLWGMGLGAGALSSGSKAVSWLARPVVVNAVTKGLEKQGLGELAAKALIRDVASPDAKVAGAAAVKMMKTLGVDPKEVRAMRQLYRTGVVKEGDLKGMDTVLARLRSVPEAQRSVVLDNVDKTLSEVNTAKMNPGNREQAMEAIVAGAQFGVSPKLLAGHVNDWDTGLDGLARAYDMAGKEMAAPEVSGLATEEARKAAAFDRALEKMGVENPKMRAEMVTCGTKPKA